ncbi:NAD(P)-dependent oxidoreductase [Actinophytocola oryzae]|uniref:Phosphoglycerate dehydrogenase-like enzyme n=1 Tax=Actinophytocola oryzae TaxID=502181 RepID=A0A4R7VY24_9PSEU|nr:NAD(P)-dependent oxidoreductase [Actinophytocola oryzae]TDV54117.1 phosphoglycerate dehydrogenase-like enzyme [Actinophytocola oryzae]
MITVLVPDEAGEAALSGVDGIDVVRYESADDLLEHAEVLVPGFLVESDPAALAARLPHLRLIQLLTAGAENWIGKVPPNVTLSTARGAHGGSTAEWALTVLLAVYRDLIPFERGRVARTWERTPTETLLDKRVLVIGAGDLGTQLKRRLDACDARTTLVGYRARDGVHGIDEVPDLLGSHDAVVLMVPLTAATTGMVDAAFLSRMRDNAVLVNAARGKVVNTDALVAELVAGRLRAALDVTEPEPPPRGHPLWTAPNLLLTPHVAASVEGYQERAYRVVAAEIARFAAGEPLHNVVHGDY